MIKRICSLFVRDCENFSDRKVRKTYGIVCSLAGIILNLLLFFIKLFAGTVSCSTAITVDAVHNLADMGSSVVTLVSFILPEKGKYIKENLVGFIIGLALTVTGFRLAVLSVEKILAPAELEFSFLTVFLLLFSVCVKFCMAYYYSGYGRKTDSPALKASAADCLCDSLATAVSLIAVVASCFTAINADGWCGLVVSLFILYSGCRTAVICINGLLMHGKNKL